MKKSYILLIVLLCLGACSQKAPENTKNVAYKDETGKTAQIALRPSQYENEPISQQEQQGEIAEDNIGTAPPHPEKLNLMTRLYLWLISPKFNSGNLFKKGITSIDPKTGEVTHLQVERDKNGKISNFSGQQGDQSVQIQKGRWPNDWQSPMEPYPNAVVLQAGKVISREGDDQKLRTLYTIAFTTSDTPEYVVMHYKAAFSAIGFAVLGYEADREDALVLLQKEIDKSEAQVRVEKSATTNLFNVTIAYRQ